jgi:hypothetical protein
MPENEHRCRVCDGPVETPVQIVCDECKRRDTEEMEREMEFNDRSMEYEEVEEVRE